MQINTSTWRMCLDKMWLCDSLIAWVCVCVCVSSGQLTTLYCIHVNLKQAEVRNLVVSILNETHRQQVQVLSPRHSITGIGLIFWDIYFSNQRKTGRKTLLCGRTRKMELKKKKVLIFLSLQKDSLSVNFVVLLSLDFCLCLSARALTCVLVRTTSV